MREIKAAEHFICKDFVLRSVSASAKTISFYDLLPNVHAVFIDEIVLGVLCFFVLLSKLSFK